MSLQVVEKHIEPPEPEGTDDEGDYEDPACERCGSEDFRLRGFHGMKVHVCIDCSQPQHRLIWVEVGDE